MRVSDFHNKHKGRIAFILGTGPSLHFDKLDGLHGFVTFAVNASLMKYRQADYFVSDWPGVMDWDYYQKTLPKFGGVTFLPKARFGETAYHVKNVCMYESAQYYDPLAQKVNPEALRVSDDPEKPIVWARSSCGAAVHLAHLMGCDPIVLIGNDCCYVGEKSHFYHFPGEHKPQRYRGTHPPTRKTMVRGKTLDDDHRDIIEYWQNFGKANPYINIINTATQGVLDCFPKMQLADVLSRYAALTKGIS